jgi:PAS domain S-box-containing protein
LLSVLHDPPVTPEREALRERTALLQIALHAVQGLVFSADVRTGIVERSAGLYDLLGVKPEDARPDRQWWVERLHPDDVAKYVADAQAVAAGRVEYSGDLRLRHADGRWIDVWERAVAQRDDAGRVTRVVGLALDVSARKAAERSAHFLIELDRMVARQQAPAALAAAALELLCRHLELDGATLSDVDPSTRCSTVQHHWTADGHDLSGHYLLDDFGGAHWLAELAAGVTVAIDRVDTDARTATVAARFAAAGIGAIAFAPQRDSGRLVAKLAAQTAAPRRWQPAELQLMRDVIARVWPALQRSAAEAALRDSESTLKSFYESSPLLMGVVEVADDDSDIVHLYDNPATERFFGVATGSTSRRSVRHLLGTHDDTLYRWIAAYREAERDGRPVRFEYEERNAPAGPQWLACVASYIGRPSGGRARFSYVVEDVTERKRAEQALHDSGERLRWALAAERAARSEAELANREKDDFLATLSHELRSPLAVIVNWSRILLARTPAEGETARGLRLILNNALAQSQLIADLLDMSTIVAGKLKLNLQPLELAPLVAEAVAAHRPEATAKSVTLELHGEAQGLPVRGDPARLQQVLWNLLTNAIKFTPAGGRIEVRLRGHDGAAEVAVTDSGEGIAAEFLPHLFDRFRQADASAARRHGGLGLGLAIVRQLTEMHGGDVSAASAGRGCGARFTVRLPLDAEPHTASDAAAPDAAGLEGLRVLIVDDQAPMLDYLQRILEEEGMQVQAFCSAPECLGHLRTGATDFDLLVSDIGLPEIDGYELIRIVRSDLALTAERLPAIALTAFARREDQQRALAAGYQAHLAKPFQLADLFAQMRALAAPLRAA